MMTASLAVDMFTEAVFSESVACNALHSVYVEAVGSLDQHTTGLDQLSGLK